MSKLENLFLIITIMILTMFNNSYAMDHSQHGGKPKTHHDSSVGANCQKAKIDKIQPEPLAQVSPASAFSFMVFEAFNPKQIEVTVKNIPVLIHLENKNELLIVRGQLPESLIDTPARINVKIKGKATKCNLEEGWLIKIGH